MVAYRGEIIPAPFAWAASRTSPPGSLTSRQARLGPLSLVRIACEKSPASSPSERHASCAPCTTRSRGSSVPITPVEASPTWSTSMPSSTHGRLGGQGGLDSALAVAHVRATRVGGHGAQLGEPGLARHQHRRAQRALVVKRAAETVSSASEASTPTSSPSGLIPAATPAARKPLGSAWAPARVTNSGDSTQREAKKVIEALRLRQAQHQVEVLHRLAGRALPEVVDGGEGDTVVAHHGRVDAAAVGVLHVARVRRLAATSTKGSRRTPPVELAGLVLREGRGAVR